MIKHAIDRLLAVFREPLSSPRRRWIVGLCALLGVVSVVLLMPAVAHAAGLGNIEARIAAMFAELNSMAKKVAWGIFGIGVLVIGVKLNNGDPDARQRMWQFLFGGLVVYFAGDIIGWLSGNA